MTYSSAMFKNPQDNLHKGQINKYANLANITGIKENDKILRGFYYREDEIIENIEDLFNDDKEFILPKIEQLEVKFIK